MNKTSAFLIGIGILVLGFAGYWVLKPAPSTNSLDENPPLVQEDPISLFAEGIFVYKKGTDYTPQVVKVEEGKEVILSITSEIKDEAHLHGYDLSTGLEPSQEGVIKFIANKTGRFELELENSGVVLGFIEVYPK